MDLFLIHYILTSQEKDDFMRYLILSPYAINGTKNAGDDLIVKSLIFLLNSLKKDIDKEIFYDIVSIANSTLDKEDILKKIKFSKYDKILIPGFRIDVVGQEVLSTRIRYIEKAIINNIPIFLIGSSWCVFPGIIEQTNLKINPKIKALIKYIIKDNRSLITARDLFTCELLKNNGINVDVTGDLALFDFNKINTKIDNNKIEKIAISLPHNINFYKNCIKLREYLENKFKVFIVTQQYLADNKSYKELFGEANNLEWYKNIDIHIGFRLHAHLWFLRNRKPSILIAEDGRGWGHINTFDDIGIHAAPKYILDYFKKKPNESNIFKKINTNLLLNSDIINIFNNEFDNNFKKNKEVIRKIDKIFEEKVKSMIFKILEDL
jgi:hypothetical protein